MAPPRRSPTATCCSCSAPTSRTTRSCPSGKTIIQVDDKPLHLGRRAAVDLGLVGDVGETLRALIPRLEARTDSQFLDKIVKHHHKMVESIQTYVTHEGSGEGASA